MSDEQATAVLEAAQDDPMAEATQDAEALEQDPGRLRALSRLYSTGAESNGPRQ